MNARQKAKHPKIPTSTFLYIEPWPQNNVFKSIFTLIYPPWAQSQPGKTTKNKNKTVFFFLEFIRRLLEHTSPLDLAYRMNGTNEK